MTDILFTPIRLNELEMLIQNSVTKALKENQQNGNQTTLPPERKTLHSIRELSEFIGCSTVTAHAYKKSGRIPCRQIGRKVMFDTLDVLNAMDQTKKKTRK